MLDVNKLKGKLVENCLSVKEISEILSINPSTFYRKMKANSFEIGEADAIVKALNLTLAEACGIFFSQYVA